MESSASVSARLWLSSRASKQHCWAVGAPARQATCAGGRAKAQKPAYQVDKFITGNMSISQGYRHTQTTILTHRVAHTWTMQPMSRTCIRVQCQNFLHTCPMTELAYDTRTLHAGSGYARRMSVSPPPVAPTGVAVAANERYMARVVTVRLISNFISKSVMKYYVLLRARDDVTSDMYGTNTQIVQRRTASPEIVKPVRELA